MKARCQQGETRQFDVLVIGAGLAGLHYCTQLLAKHPKLTIALLCKANLAECNSRYAQGGIAAVLAPNDSFIAHCHDTLAAGDGLCYPPAVELIISQGPQAIADLQHDYQLSFDRQTNGKLDLGQEGGHQHRRIAHCGDQTGRSLMQQLIQKIQEFPQIHVFEHHIAVNLISQKRAHDTERQAEIVGAYVLDCNNNQIHAYLSRCVVLATGGAGKTYRYTTNPMIATGDGVAMAYRAGACISHMEFYQFHPTLLHHHLLTDFLISEAVRGEGGILRNADSQKPFMHQYAKEHGDLATRDVVARAIFNEIEQSHLDFVYLDITHQKKTFLRQRFPQIYTTLLSIGIDMSQDMIPVVPAAHYQCGGVVTNLHGRTDLRRLYAIGEVACTGLHGANRLASNSLLESVVMASNAARASLQDIQQPWDDTPVFSAWNSPQEVDSRRASQINAHWRSLRGEMTSYAGIIRTEAGLEDLLHLIRKRKQIIEEYYWKHAITRDLIELRNIILNAELITHAALARRESRGGHYRDDFPKACLHSDESMELRT